MDILFQQGKTVKLMFGVIGMFGCAMFVMDVLDALICVDPPFDESMRRKGESMRSCQKWVLGF